MIDVKHLNKKKHQCLIVVILSIIYLIVVIGFAATSYRIISSDAQKELGSKAMILAIDIAERLEMDSEEYERLLLLDFNQLLKDPANLDFEKNARAVMKYADIKYIYLEAPVAEENIKYFVETDESSIYKLPAGTPLNVVYLLDAVINDQSRWDDTDGQWYTDQDRYTVATEEFTQAYQSRQPTSYQNSDEWGTYITGFAPHYDLNGNYRGLIGVDLFLDTYLGYLRKNLLIMGVFVITLIAIGAFSLYLTIRVKRVENLVQEKSMLSDIDGLTYLINRRHFLELMQDRWSKGQQDKKPLALLIIDVDYFKKYNDNYGHLAGDEVLHRIAQMLEQNVRQDYDLVGRYGGDEFLILLNNTDTINAHLVADNLIKKINYIGIEHQYSSICTHVTVTIGLATIVLPGPDSTFEELFQRADSALYYGKEHGGNQVQTWNDSIPDKSNLSLADL